MYIAVSPGAIAVSNGFFSDLNILPSIDDVQCLGTELGLLNCSYSNSPDSSCVERDDAGAACQGNIIGLCHCLLVGGCITDDRVSIFWLKTKSKITYLFSTSM